MMVKITKSSGDVFKDLGVERPERELKDLRFQMMLASSEVELIEDWMFARRIKSRAEAIRRLVKIGLEHSENGDSNA